MQGLSQQGGQLPFGGLSFTCAAVSKRVDQCEKFIEHRVLRRYRRNHLVKRLESAAAQASFWRRPNRLRVFPFCNLFVEGRGGMGRWYAPSDFSASCGERVLHPVDEKFLNRSQERSVMFFVDQPCELEPLE
jgi:hypothetical protein